MVSAKLSNSKPTPSTPLQIHLLNPKSDADLVTSLAKMEKRLFPKNCAYGSDDLAEETKRRNAFLLYIKNDNTTDIVGYIFYTVNSTVAHINKLLVNPTYRRQGFASALVTEAATKAKKERRVGSITLHVDTSNEAALKLYERLGFVQEARFEDYYTINRHAYKMRLELNSG